MDDRTLSEKLAELDSLPAGYTPNLASKWALLEASLEGQDNKKRTLFVLGRAAAVLVLFFSLWYWLLQGLSIQPVVQDKYVVPVKVLQAPAKVPAAVKEETAAHAKKPLHKEPALAAKEEACVASEVPSAEVPVQEIAPLAPGATPSVAVEAVPAKKKKARYVQMDFGEPVKETNGTAPAYYAKHPEFRMFGDHEPEQNTSHTNSRTAVVRINF